MASSSPAKKQATRGRTEKANESSKDSTESLSPTAEALKALKNLASPATTKKNMKRESNLVASNPTEDRLRIQAPMVRSTSGDSGGAGISGLASISPAGSGPSAPTSPADDGTDTPDSRDVGHSKRPRLLDPGSGSSSTSSANTPTPSTPPLFLEKTYEMLDKCSPQVACWSASGDSFIVKNPVAFAEHVIPIYFKHKNFSSFVRQLNFYGFRKVRVVDPDVTGGVDPKDWWEFRHDKFQRGQKGLLKEIKRRSLPNASATQTPSASETVATVDRGEIDELRAEVATLREQIQTLNKHMFSVMQIMMTRNVPPTPTNSNTTSPPSPFPTPHVPHPHATFPSIQPPTTPHVLAGYPFVGGLPPPHPPQTAAVSLLNKSDKTRGTVTVPPTVTSPGAVYALRPIQSFVNAAGVPVPSGYVYPVTPSSEPTLDWELYSRHAFHAAQAAHAQAAAAAAVASGQASSVSGTVASPNSVASTPASSVPAVVGLKRSRSQQKRSPQAMTTTTPPASTSIINAVDNPEAAVRQLSMQVTHIRADLLQSILSRTVAFIGAQPPSTTVASNDPEIGTIATAITEDIQQRLAQINEAEAVTHGRPRDSPPSETSHMYRVEMLKYVSKELPRAMSEAVEKRLPASTKKTLNRSLLALMVQKAQGALENQMRIETASTSPSVATPTSSSLNTRSQGNK